MLPMNACPFCKSAVSDPQAPCKICGRRASDPPQRGVADGIGDDWGDDLSGGTLGLSSGGLSRGGAHESSGGNASAYTGGGLSFADDDPFADEVPPALLELDVPSSHAARSIPAAHSSTLPSPELRGGGEGEVEPAEAPSSSRAAPAGSLAPPARLSAAPKGASLPPTREGTDESQSLSEQVLAPTSTSAASRAADPAAIIARYPHPPATGWEAPLYAARVLWRQFELRQDLASLRKRRSPDVPLFERALTAYDAKRFKFGLLLLCTAFTIASLAFFSPVIVRIVLLAGR